MKTLKIELIGLTPLLQHKMPEEELFALLGTKTKKNKDKEEKTPREIADRYAYRNPDGTFYVPAEYISGAIATVAADYKQKNSIRKSLKHVARGVFRPVTGQILITDESGNSIKEFEVDIRKGTNHQKGAIAICRPRFDKWKLSFEATIDDTIVSEDTVQQMLEDSGRRSGIGSFRVSRGGFFGQFRVSEFKVVT